ncbi:hypothetical protein ACFDTO_28585 [Microbacteriaceae bacterium 4G12]
MRWATIIRDRSLPSSDSMPRTSSAPGRGAGVEPATASPTAVPMPLSRSATTPAVSAAEDHG